MSESEILTGVELPWSRDSEVIEPGELPSSKPGDLIVIASEGVLRIVRCLLRGKVNMIQKAVFDAFRSELKAAGIYPRNKE